MVSVTLTFDRLILNSIGIIYTPIQMSVLNLTNLSRLCVYLSSTQGLVYINVLTVTVTLTFDQLTSE